MQARFRGCQGKVLLGAVCAYPSDSFLSPDTGNEMGGEHSQKKYLIAQKMATLNSTRRYYP
jgi:hypothetical protein